MGCSHRKEAEQGPKGWPEANKSAVNTLCKPVIYSVEFWSSHHLQAAAEIALKVEEAAVVRETIICGIKRPDPWQYGRYHT